jgi:hypothetical protein
MAFWSKKKDVTQDIESDVLSGVLLTEVIEKSRPNDFRLLCEAWSMSPDQRAHFFATVRLYRYATVVLGLSLAETSGSGYGRVMRHLQDTVRGHMDNFGFRNSRGLEEQALARLKELIWTIFPGQRTFAEQSAAMPWTMATMRELGLINQTQTDPLTREGLGMFWAMAWLKDLGRVETNVLIQLL